MKTKKLIRSICSIALALVCCVATVSPIPTRAAYNTEKFIDFSQASDANFFATTYGGYSIVDGVFKPNNAWANTYLTDTISLATDKVISFDFYLTDDQDAGHQFNVGLTNANASFTGGISWHFNYNTNHAVELLTLNTAFGNTYEGWIADTVVDYFDGQKHTMKIAIENKVASFQIDGNEVLKNQAVGLDAPHLVFQATSTDYTIDNIKIESEVPEYNTLDVDFNEAEDANVFATSYGGYSISNGVFKPNNAWANTYVNGQIPLTEDKEISFDFTLTDDSDPNHQFNIGLANVTGTTFTGGISLHFNYNANHLVELLTLNTTFGNTYKGWIADTVVDYFDGQTHTMTITIIDKTASFKIDGNDVLTSTAVGLDAPYLVFQSSSADYTIDNLKIKAAEKPAQPDPVLPVYSTLDVDFEEVEDSDIFTTNYEGWSIANGVFKPNTAWANTYLNGTISLEEDTEISFDFTLTDDNNPDHQLNVGLVNVEGNNFVGGLVGHFYYNTTHQIELLSLNNTFGNAHDGWIEDNLVDYFDGQTHTMTITIIDGMASFKVDGNDVLTSALLGIEAPTLVFQATSTEYTIDNVKIKAPEPQVPQEPEIPVAPEYSEQDIDFEEAEDGDVFTTNNSGWVVADGVYKPSTAWATTYFNFEIPLDEDKEISLDFCLKNGSDKNHQFNFGFVNVDGDTVTSYLAGHFYCHASFGEMFTLNRDFSSPTGNHWIADNMNNYNDGKVHTLIIQVHDGKVKTFVDNKTLVSEVALTTDNASFILQATSTDTYVDNVKVSDTLTTIVEESNDGGEDEGALSEQTYREMSLDFSKVSDADVFATNNGGWIVENGIYKPSIAWATTYFNFKIPFSTSKEISFDFCLKNGSDKNHQFNFGFVDIQGNTVGKGLSGHIYNNSVHGEMFTLNRDFSSPTGQNWIIDNMTNYNDGKVHNMLIQVQNGKVKICIDKVVIFQNINLGTTSSYFILQATSTDTYVDNMKLSNKLTDTSKYSVSNQNVTTQAPTAGTMGAGSYPYKEMEYDFSSTKDGEAFSTNFNGWSVVEGVYKPNSEWATTYPNCLIPLNEDKEISFDFFMADVESDTRQFNVAFVMPNGEKFNTFLAAHFYQHASYGEILTLNKDFGNPIGEGWIADNMDHFNDGQTHTMMIRVKDGMVAIYIDGKEIFTEIPLDAKEAYFIMQFTSADSYIDNFRISDTLTYIPDFPVNNPDPEGDETTDGATTDGLKETQGKVVLGITEILLIAGAVVVIGGGTAGAVILKKKRKGKING